METKIWNIESDRWPSLIGHEVPTSPQYFRVNLNVEVLPHTRSMGTDSPFKMILKLSIDNPMCQLNPFYPFSSFYLPQLSILSFFFIFIHFPFIIIISITHFPIYIYITSSLVILPMWVVLQTYIIFMHSHILSFTSSLVIFTHVGCSPNLDYFHAFSYSKFIPFFLSHTSQWLWQYL